MNLWTEVGFLRCIGCTLEYLCTKKEYQDNEKSRILLRSVFGSLANFKITPCQDFAKPRATCCYIMLKQHNGHQL